MKMFLLLALLSFVIAFIIGCATLNSPRLGAYYYTQRAVDVRPPIRTVPIWVDKNFGEADQLTIADAIAAWNYTLNGYIKLEIVDTNFDMEIDKIVSQVNQNGWLFMRINGLNPLIPSNDKGYWTIAFVERIGGHHLYLVRDRLNNADVFGVTLHEIGHLLGAGHVGDHLMYPHYTAAGYQCVDLVSMQAVAAYQHLDWTQLNFCTDKDASQVSELRKGPLGGGVEEPNCPLGSPDYR